MGVEQSKHVPYVVLSQLHSEIGVRKKQKNGEQKISNNNFLHVKNKHTTATPA